MLNLKIRVANSLDKTVYDLLELADPSREIINNYLVDSKVFLAFLKKEVIAVIVLKERDDKAIEVMNLAVTEKFQGNGYGKHMLSYAIDTCSRLGYKNLYIATGNSSSMQLAFYQKMKFKINSIEENYFIENYKEEIFENGIQCKDKIILKREL